MKKMMILALLLGTGGAVAPGKDYVPEQHATTHVQEKHIELPTSPFYTPPHVGDGDKDFWGHGPIVDLSVELLIRNERELWGRFSIVAREDGGDRTRAEGNAEYQLYTLPSGKIVSITSDTFTSVSYTDHTWEEDRIPISDAKELVREFIVVGDTYGPEAGSRTGFRANFNTVTLKVEE